MKKEINVSYNGDFSQYLDNIMLVADDVQAYEIVFSTPFDLTGAAFMITASRKDGKVVQDVGECNGSTATYTIKNAMYCVPDEVTIRLTLVKDDTMLTSKELVIPVAEPTGKGTTVSIDETAIANSALMISQQALALANALNANGKITLLTNPTDDEIIALSAGEYLIHETTGYPLFRNFQYLLIVTDTVAGKKQYRLGDSIDGANDIQKRYIKFGSPPIVSSWGGLLLQDYTKISSPLESEQAWNFTTHRPVWYDGTKWIYGDGSVVA